MIEDKCTSLKQIVRRSVSLDIDNPGSINWIGNCCYNFALNLNRFSDGQTHNFAREIYDFYKIIGDMEEKNNEITSTLTSFLYSESIGGQVHYAHSMGILLKHFLQICDKLFCWLEKNREFTQTVGFIIPVIEDPISMDHLRYPYSVYINNLIDEMGRIQEKLQALKSPNPQKFPTASEISCVFSLFKEFCLKAHITKEVIREYASKNLDVKDFFVV